MSRGETLELPGTAGSGTGRMKSRRRRRRRGLWKIIMGDERMPMSSTDIVPPSIFDDLNWYDGQGGDGGRDKREAEEGVMDEVVCSTVQLDVLERWDAEKDIAYIKDILQGGESFTELFTGENELQGLPGQRSALTSAQIDDLTRYGVMERKAQADGKVLNVVKAFTVPKPNGLRRLVVDGRTVGDAQEEPPHTCLPNIADIRRLVRENAFIAQYDGKSWFYQLNAAGLKKYFALRTCKGVYWMKVLPMGWSWSVWIAQTVAKQLANKGVERAHKRGSKTATAEVYIDNFLLAAKSLEEAAVLCEEIQRTAVQAGAVLKPGDGPREVEDALGMTLNCRDKTIALKEAWRAKFEMAVKKYLLAPSKWSLRTTWKLLGGIMWATRVLDIKHFRFPHLKAWMSRNAQRIAEGVASWESQAPWWKHALDDLKKVCVWIANNNPSTVLEPEALSRETLWVDASTTGGGFLLENRGDSGAWPWSIEDSKLPIHILEAKALRKGLQHWVRVREKDEGVDIKTDSTLVYYAVRNGKARGLPFNLELKLISDLLCDHSYNIDWVPTAEQKADDLSRAFARPV